MPPTADCPHCKARGTLAPTKTARTDTSGTKVIVWKCSVCKYTEGR